jgi:LysM repeat protein
LVIAFCSFLSLVGCAKPPQQQLEAAEYMVAKAYAADAETYAAAEYQAANAALQAGQAAIESRSYSSAEESLEFALQHARRAISLTIDTKEKLAAEQEAQRRIEAERAAAMEREAQKARKAEPAIPFKKPKPTMAPTPPTPPATTYTVREGENLWIISNREVVYGDGFLWPLLYQANRDQIKDPQQIYPGQVLNIRRDLTEQEMEEARIKAKESDVFPIPDQFKPAQKLP